MPARKKPNHLKVLSGSRRIDDHQTVDLPPVSEIPPPPDWLPNAFAVREWNRLAPILFDNGLLTEASLSTLGVLCSCYGELAKQYSAGLSPTGHLVAQYRNLINDFGMTPSSASKVRASGDQAKPNRFANNGKRPAKGNVKK